MGVGLTLKEQEMIKVLSAEGKSWFAIAKAISRSPHTVKKYLLSSEDVQADVDKIKEDLAAMFEGVAKRMVASITDPDIVKLDAYRRTLSAGIATDKMRLLREQSTQNISSLTALCIRLDPVQDYTGEESGKGKELIEHGR